MTRVYRSTHKQNRWLCCGSYRQPACINWRALLTDVVSGVILGGVLLAIGLKILQGVAM